MSSSFNVANAARLLALKAYPGARVQLDPLGSPSSNEWGIKVSLKEAVPESMIVDVFEGAKIRYVQPEENKVTYKQAKAQTGNAEALGEQFGRVSSIATTRLESGFAIRIALEEEVPEGTDLPNNINGVPLIFIVTGPIEFQGEDTMSSESLVLDKSEIHDLIEGAKVVSINHYSDDEKSSLVLDLTTEDDAFLLVLKANAANDVIAFTKEKPRSVGGHQILNQYYGDVIRPETSFDDDVVTFSFDINDDLTVVLDGHKLSISSGKSVWDAINNRFHELPQYFDDGVQMASAYGSAALDQARQYRDRGLSVMSQYPVVTAVVPLALGVIFGALLGAAAVDFTKKQQKKWW
jgi:hypothetical protein